MKIVINNKETSITLEKDQIVEVIETADGLAFHLRNNLSLVFTDGFFPSNAKQLVRGAVDRCQVQNGTITVDLQNHITPARIEAGLVKEEMKEDKPGSPPGKKDYNQSPPDAPPQFAR